MSATDLPLLLEPQQLASFLKDAANDSNLLILDTSSADNYARHHVPGAIHIPPQLLQSGAPPVPGKLPNKDHLQQLFSAVGLHKDKHVISYDDEGGGWAGRLIWTLDVLGHKQYSYLNGGIHAWKGDGLETQAGQNQPEKSDYQVTINTAPIADIDDIVPRLGDDNFAIWDARSAEEYNGSRIGAKRSGHIPGAINLDWLNLMDRERALRLIDLDKLQQLLDNLGLSRDKDIVTHCQTHHRSGLSYLAMKILGYPSIKGYHGSWSEWGNRDDTPIET